jgi:hypothetical protein
MSNFICSMPEAGLMEMPPADDQARLFLRALGHSQEGPHPFFLHLLRAQDRDTKPPLLSHSQRLLSQMAGSGHIPGPGLEGTGQVLAPGLGQPDSDSFRRALGIVRTEEAKLRHCPRLFPIIFGFQLFETPGGQDHALYRRLGGKGRPQLPARIQPGRKTRDAEPFCDPHGSPQDPPYGLGIQLCRLPGTDEEDALGTLAPRPEEE